MRATTVLALAALAAGAPLACAATPPVVLNEVYYDAPGADAGYQFVELYNRTDQAVALAGWRLEAGDGAGPGRWRALWTGQAGDVAPPRGRFTVGEAGVRPAPDRVQAVDLENGPDAVRLVGPDGATDVLGYGALTYAEYFAGRPAPDVPGGSSLARSPDGADTGDNAADFVALSPPTPGAPNRPEIDLALQRATASERVEPGEPVRVRATLVNRGLDALPAAGIATLLWAAPRPPDTGAPGAAPGETALAPDSLVARADGARDLEPGDSAEVELAFTPPARGAWDVTVACTVLDDGVAADDRAAFAVQVGAGALVVSEVCAAPREGPEWVEFANASGAPVLLAGWTVEDATGRRAAVAQAATDGSLGLVAADSLVVVTGDPAALLALHPELSPARVMACAPWPSLNNAAPAAGGPADRVVVRAPDGRASDALDLPAADADGATLERRSLSDPTGAAANWGPSAVPGGTPGAGNSIAGGARTPGVALVASRGVAAPGQRRPALLAYRTGFERARVALRVYDLRGRAVRQLLDGSVAPGQAGVAWDGADAAGHAVAPGLYVAGLTASDAGVGSAASPGPAVRARACVVVQ